MFANFEIAIFDYALLTKTRGTSKNNIWFLRRQVVSYKYLNFQTCDDGPAKAVFELRGRK